VIFQTSVTDDKNVAETGSTPPTATSTTSSFNLDEAALFVAGAVPETGFSYFGHYEMYQDGNSNLEQGFGVWTGGRPTIVTSSRPAKCTCRRVKERGQPCSTTSSLIRLHLTNIDPINFTLDQHPVGVDVGYTHASNYFKNIFAVSAKITNGLNADVARF